MRSEAAGLRNNASWRARMGGLPENQHSSSPGGSCITSQGDQRPGGFLARYHQVPKPGTEAASGIVLHGAQFGAVPSASETRWRCARHCGEAHPHMAIVED